MSCEFYHNLKNVCLDDLENRGSQLGCNSLGSPGELDRCPTKSEGMVEMWSLTGRGEKTNFKSGLKLQ
jgi:hypothetical protein